MSPSPFVVEWAARLAPRVPAPRRALDLAMGRGRHAIELARNGLRTYGVDRRLDAVRDAVDLASSEGLTLQVWCADLTEFPLPPGAFDLVVVARYLQRSLFSAIRETITPGGLVVYETFTARQREHGTGPTSPDHLLEPGELRERFSGFEVLFDQEVTSPEAVARIVARRPRTLPYVVHDPVRSVRL
jgi:tellurite methyltransferase